MDIERTLIQEIQHAIGTNSVVRNYLEALYPRLSSRLNTSFYDIDTLEEILTQCTNSTSTTYQNILIAIRLAGGLEEVRVATNLSRDDLFELLHSRDQVSHSKLITHLTEANLVSSSFFAKPRTFFNEKQIARFRRENVTTLLSKAQDFKLAFSSLTEVLAPRTGELLNIQKAIITKDNDWACRKIEKVTGLAIGELDRCPRL